MHKIKQRSRSWFMDNANIEKLTDSKEAPMLRDSKQSFAMFAGPAEVNSDYGEMRAT